jgi:hypothetical protein
VSQKVSSQSEIPMANNAKGSNVELSTFLSWGKESIIGYKMQNVENRVVVNFA